MAVIQLCLCLSVFAKAAQGGPSPAVTHKTLCHSVCGEDETLVHACRPDHDAVCEPKAALTGTGRVHACILNLRRCKDLGLAWLT